MKQHTFVLRTILELLISVMGSRALIISRKRLRCVAMERSDVVAPN